MPALTFNLLEEIIMEFLNQLEIQEVQESSEFGERSFRLFMGTKVRGVRVSIQASYGHYCNPRKTLRDLSQYTTMEFALLNESEDFVTVTDVLPSFTRLEEIEDYYEGSVYPFVPVDLINDFYNELKGVM